MLIISIKSWIMSRQHLKSPDRALNCNLLFFLLSKVVGCLGSRLLLPASSSQIVWTGSLSLDRGRGSVFSLRSLSHMDFDFFDTQILCSSSIHPRAVSSTLCCHLNSPSLCGSLTKRSSGDFGPGVSLLTVLLYDLRVCGEAERQSGLEWFLNGS